MPKGLTAKQQAFAEFYTDFSNKTTFNNGLESARAANYKGNKRTLTSIAAENLTKLDIIKAIGAIRAERRAKSEYDRQKCEQELHAAYELAELQKNPVAMVAAARGKAKLYGLETDKLVTDNTRQRELSEKEQVEARRIASIRLQDTAGEAQAG